MPATRKNKKNKKYKNKHKSQINTRKFKKLKCAPRQSFNIDKKLQKFSCYNSSDIFKMKTIWNSSNKKKITTNNPKKIWEFLRDNLDDKCYNELCWLDNNLFKQSSLINKDILKEVFRPKLPDEWKENPFAWLSSDDIINVMKQYEKAYPHFMFIGPSPIDFDEKLNFGSCVWESLCNLNIKNYIKNKKYKIGIILNLDTHDKSGSHWVSLFIDLKNKFLFYFDSNGESIPNRVKVLINRIKEQGANINIEFTEYSNKDVEHQQKDGQCGIYALYFIIELLKETKKPNYFNNKLNLISDELMKKHRFIYFNKY